MCLNAAVCGEVWRDDQVMKSLRISILEYAFAREFYQKLFERK